MEGSIVAEYDYYTLDQAREIIYAEMRHDRIMRNKHRKEADKARAEKLGYRFKQVINGMALIGISLILSVLIGENVVAGILINPAFWIGCYSVVTRERIMY